MSGWLDALGLGRGEVVALCGAGGKSTLARALCASAREAGWRVALTATTHCGLDAELPVEFEADGLAAVARALDRAGAVQVVSAVGAHGRARGLKAEAAGALAQIADLVVVEADGARGRILKAPAPHEPALPRPCTCLVAVCAMSALGVALDERHVHRLERVLALCGREEGSVVDLDVMAATFGPGGYGSAGGGARRALFLATAGALEGGSALLLAARLAPHYGRVAAGDARCGELVPLTLSSPR